MNSPSANDIVIIGARRTPQGKFLGQLSGVNAIALGATALKAAIESSGVQGSQIDAVVFGQVVQASTGQNPARQTALAAGVPLETPAVTVNSVCLSGLRAIIDAARLIRLGDAQLVAAGGQESMSQAPHLIPNSRVGYTYGAHQLVDSLERDALTDAFDHNSMGLNTDRGNLAYEIDRQSQDVVAANSHQRAVAAWEEGAFDAEIAPVSVPRQKAEPLMVARDEGIRPGCTVASLAELRPAFVADGTITAGNASPLSDGAAAVVMTTREWAERHNAPILAALGGSAHVGGPDTSLHSQPSNAVALALKKSSWSAVDLDFLEVNEAFASVSIVTARRLGLSPKIINIHGGAIALGHPVGATGARLVVHAAQELARRGSGRSAVALCGGGGQGDALLLWR